MREEREAGSARAARPRQHVKLDLGPPSLVAGVTDDFSELPRDAKGLLVSVAHDALYSRYVDWLADYLYRPAVTPSDAGTLTLKQAWPPVRSIATAIAIYLWQKPSEEYPPVRYRGIPRPIHADFIHRAELSKILSRVPRRKHRRELLNRFYTQLAEDLDKGR